MIFCYRCDNCDKAVEAHYPAGQAAASVECDCGALCRRDYLGERKTFADAAFKAGEKYPYVSNRLPRNHPDCPADSKGRPVIQSARHERELCAKHGYRRE